MRYVLDGTAAQPAQHRDVGATEFADREMLEMLLFRAVPRSEVRRLAEEALARFGSFADAIAAPPRRLAEVEGMTPAAITEFKLLEAAVLRFIRETMRKRLPLGSEREVVDYCRTATASEDREIFRVLFLDEKNALIADEALGVGAGDPAPFHPREVIRRALELSASGIILVHNHPRGDPTPTAREVSATLDIVAVSGALGLVVRDHVIVARDGHASLKGMGLI